jgi:hypothetical protein
MNTITGTAGSPGAAGPGKGGGFKCFTGSQIKMLGVIMMVFDHLHQMFYTYGAPLWFTCIGRLVAPLFLFMCAEGYYYTRSKGKYMLLLLAGFEFMNVASRVIGSAMPNPDVMLINNIFGSLLLCTVYMRLVDMLCAGARERKPGKAALSIILMLAPIGVSVGFLALIATPGFAEFPHMRAVILLMQMIPNPLMVEGGPIFIILGLLFYIFRKKRIIQAVLLIAVGGVTAFIMEGVQWMMLFAAIPMLMYNGERGKGSKYFFYVFYPAHIYILYTIAWLLIR